MDVVITQEEDSNWGVEPKGQARIRPGNGAVPNTHFTAEWPRPLSHPFPKYRWRGFYRIPPSCCQRYLFKIPSHPHINISIVKIFMKFLECECTWWLVFITNKIHNMPGTIKISNISSVNLTKIPSRNKFYFSHTRKPIDLDAFMSLPMGWPSQITFSYKVNQQSWQ